MAKTKAKAKVKPAVKKQAKVVVKKSIKPLAKNKSVSNKKATSSITKKASAKKPVAAEKILNSNKKKVLSSLPKKNLVQTKIKAKSPNQAIKKIAPVLTKNNAAAKAKNNKLQVAAVAQKSNIKTANKKEKPVVEKALKLDRKQSPIAEKAADKKAGSVFKPKDEIRKKLDFPKKRAGRKPKNKGGDDDDGFELLEVPKLDPIIRKPSPKKFVIPISTEVYVNPNAKQVAPPKNIGNYKKFEIEFPINASPYIIYGFVSTPAGLSEWFAENVNVRNDEYTFLWDGSQQTATLLSKKENTFIKFRWNDEPDFTFFEFRIVVDEITQDVAFWVTDFAEDEKSKEASILLWNSQIDALIHAMGA